MLGKRSPEVIWHRRFPGILIRINFKVGFILGGLIMANFNPAIIKFLAYGHFWDIFYWPIGGDWG